MWSYDGWNQLNFVSQELKNPTRNFPIVICVGIPLVTVCYLLVNVAYFTVMTPAEVLASNSVAVTFGDRVFGSFSWIVPIGVACSTFGAANGMAFTAARLSYSAGVNGHFPKFISYLSHSRLTPLMAIIFNTTLAVIMIIPDTSSISALLDYFSFAMWIIYFLTFLSIIVMRYTEPMKHVKRDFQVIKVLFYYFKRFQVWLPLPIICALIALYLVIGPIIEYPSMSYLLATILIFAGLLFYIPFVYMGWTLPLGAYQKLEIFVQKYFEVVPVDMDKND